jgi:transcriptional regulator with PAS, ATPase and Fis domain
VGISFSRVRDHLTRLLDLACRESQASRGCLVVCDGDDRPVVDLIWPAHDQPFARRAAGTIRRAVEERRPLVATASRPPSSAGGGQAGEAEGGSLLCWPFLVHQRPIGAVCLGRDPGRAPFTSEDLETLHFLCGPIRSVIREHLVEMLPPAEPESASNGDPIVGRSPASTAIRAFIAKVKDTTAPVFIYGESGTGKELIAKAIHERGKRGGAPFVAVNCGAIPDHLLESELFGHTRGAFTGALRDKAGLIEEAYGGTFFLDEIGDLSLPLQAKLLRLLQEKEIRRIGETRTRPVDVRFISATNKNIEKEIERGNFRLDLSYRLRILTVEVPPLRERRDDFLPIANHLLDRYCRDMKRERVHISPEALELMIGYAWPGNVRELQNELQRCLVLALGDDLIKKEHLSSRINPRGETSSGASFNYFAAKAEFETRFLSQALDRFGQNKARTAAGIGLTRQGLFKLLKKHNLGTRR